MFIHLGVLLNIKKYILLAQRITGIVAKWLDYYYYGHWYSSHVTRLQCVVTGIVAKWIDYIKYGHWYRSQVTELQRMVTGIVAKWIKHK